MLNYQTAQFYRNYTLYERVTTDGTDWVGMQGSDVWFEGATPEDVMANIDLALAEAK